MFDVVLRRPFRVVPVLRMAIFGGAVLLFFASQVASVCAGGDALFNEKVAPILAQRCVSCHDGDKAKGGLDLSTHKGLLAGGDKGPVIVVGKAAESKLLKMVSGTKPAMPKGGDQRLSDDQVASLKAWIDAARRVAGQGRPQSGASDAEPRLVVHQAGRPSRCAEAEKCGRRSQSDR